MDKKRDFSMTSLTAIAQLISRVGRWTNFSSSIHQDDKAPNLIDVGPSSYRDRLRCLCRLARVDARACGFDEVRSHGCWHCLSMTSPGKQEAGMWVVPWMDFQTLRWLRVSFLRVRLHSNCRAFNPQVYRVLNEVICHTTLSHL